MYGPYLSSIGGGQPLSSPKRHSLGRPLPYQLADTSQATLLAINPDTNFGIVAIVFLLILLLLFDLSTNIESAD